MSADETSTAEPEAPSQGRARAKLALAILLAACALAAGAGFTARWGLKRWAAKPFGAPGQGEVSIARGTSFAAAARELKARGIVGSDLLFIAYARLEGKQASLEAGDFTIALPVAPRDLLAQLGHGTFARKLTIPEGWTAAQIEAELLRGGWIKQAGEWKALAAAPLDAKLLGHPLPEGAEGFCFPDTYSFERGTAAPEILRAMLGEFARVWAALEPERRDPRSAGLSPREIVTLASIIEREARGAAEMPRIASVFLNRLKRPMKLQSCATVHYALGEVWDRALRKSDLEIDSPYNTYRVSGLPAGPIGNPGREALAAALRPAETDDLYFVYRGDGTHEFTKTYREHMKAARKHLRADPAAALAEAEP